MFSLVSRETWIFNFSFPKKWWEKCLTQDYQEFCKRLSLPMFREFLYVIYIGRFWYFFFGIEGKMEVAE